MSPNEVATTTLGRMAAAVKGYVKSKGGAEESNVPSDEDFERYQIAKATTGVSVKEVSIEGLLGKIGAKPGK